MAIHMVAQVGGQEFDVTLSRDEAGNYVAEAARLRRGARGPEVPRVRVVDKAKERALRSLFDSLERLTASQPEGPDAPAAA